MILSALHLLSCSNCIFSLSVAFLKKSHGLELPLIHSHMFLACILCRAIVALADLARDTHPFELWQSLARSSTQSCDIIIFLWLHV